jgi:hypothetical protein
MRSETLMVRSALLSATLSPKIHSLSRMRSGDAAKIAKPLMVRSAARREAPMPDRKFWF